MNTFFKPLCTLLCVFFLAGCLYIDTTMPFDKDLDKTQLGSKTGEASMYSLFWLVAWGDAGSKAAAENGNITTLNHADHHIYSVLFGIYTRETTIVYGD